MKARFSFVVVFAAFLFLATPIANSATVNGSTQKAVPVIASLTTACGSTVKNTCRGRCYLQYENFICGNPGPKPGQVGKHKKELKQCYQGCPAGK
jgi:hypothetical protein